MSARVRLRLRIPRHIRNAVQPARVIRVGTDEAPHILVVIPRVEIRQIARLVLTLAGKAQIAQQGGPAVALGPIWPMQIACRVMAPRYPLVLFRLLAARVDNPART